MSVKNPRWDGIKAVWAVALGPALKATLPYPDLRRRRQIRKEARRLVTCEPWPGNDATPVQLAQLALIRALWLQRETRRAARHGEAAALLARSALEACYVGLYCLYSDDPLTAMRGGNARAMRRMLANYGYADIITGDVLAAMADEIGGSGKLPDTRTMAETIGKALKGAPFPTNLYWRMHVPLSEFFVHANGLSLLRHVGAEGKLLDEPTYPWARRCAVRTADGCVGFLAAAIAHSEGHPSERLGKYADDHMARALAPLAVVSGKGLLRSFGLAKIARLAKGILDLRAYNISGRADNETWESRVRFLRSWFEQYFAAAGEGVEEIWDLYIDGVVTVLAGPPPAGNQSEEAADDPDAPPADDDNA
ncbi:MAG: hypothetical protein ACYDAQ_00205 [Mycobacteriales bacterium]